MHVIFRTDASLKIGTGHVMRCITLAKALKENSVNVEFICRKHDGNLVNRIRSNGFSVYELDLLEGNVLDKKLSHSHWLGVTQQQDVDDCINILKSKKTNWIIIDHYALDEDWQNKLKPFCDKIMVIDDLADRKHQCDVLLDQTYGCRYDDYAALIPASCELLLGSQYALIRPEFYKYRQYSLERRIKSEFKHLLINMGGVDLDNFTAQVLKELKNCTFPNDMRITVIMGEFSPHLKNVQSIAEFLPYKVEVKVDVNNMAEIMANTDIAVGASGSTVWERCCLGLPSIQIAIADNQTSIARNLDSINAIQLIDNVHELPIAIDRISKSISKISLVSSSIVDCKGSKKVAEFITCKEKKPNTFPQEGGDNKF